MITVSMNGTPIPSAIMFSAMTPWTATLKYGRHEIDGANYDKYVVKGRNSRTATITGVCRRTAANIGILDAMRGSMVTVSHSEEGSRTGLCLSVTPAESTGGLYLTFTMTVAEQ